MKLKPRLLFPIVVLSMVLIFLSDTVASAQMDVSQDLLARSSIAISTDGKVAMAVQKDVNYLVAGDVPGQVRLPVAFANLSGENGLIISELTLMIEGTDYQDKKVTEIKLAGLPDAGVAIKPDAVPPISRYSFSALKKSALIRVQSFKLPAGIIKGTPQILRITAVISQAGGTKSTAEVKSILTFSTLPTRTGWYCGDGHMHTTWSDGLDSLDERAAYIKNAGMGWAVITDHEKSLRGRFTAYNRAVTAISGANSLPLAAGMEIIAAGDRGHALAYGLNGQVSSVPADRQYACQALIDNINTILPDKSFAVIAHPCSSTIWQDIKTSRGFQIMEIASGGAINEQAFSEWMSRLRNGEKITALGSSDCHLGYPDGMTYLFIPDYSSSSFEPVWKAIKMGRASVSEKGHLGVLAINGQAIGSTITVSPGTLLNFILIQQPCSGITCSQVEVWDENGQVIYKAAHPPEKTAFTIPAGSRFYLLRAYFSDGSKVVSNPIDLTSGK